MAQKDRDSFNLTTINNIYWLETLWIVSSATIETDGFQNAVRHAVNQLLEELRRDAGPSRKDGLFEVIHRVVLSSAFVHLSEETASAIFDRIQIRTTGSPIQKRYSALFKKFLGGIGNVNGGIALHKSPPLSAHSLAFINQIGSVEHFLVADSIHPGLDKLEIEFAVSTNCAPHHDAATAACSLGEHLLGHVGVRPVILEAVWSVQIEFLLVREQDLAPLVFPREAVLANSKRRTFTV